MHDIGYIRKHACKGNYLHNEKNRGYRELRDYSLFLRRSFQ